MAKRPLLEITAESLVRLKQKLYLDCSENKMCREMCWLIDSVAKYIPWNLNAVKWTHEDGRRFKGLDCIQENPVLTLETLREMNEKRLTEVHCFRQKGYLAVVLQNCKGTYTCFEYSRDFIGSEEDWTSTLWSDNATSNEVFKWLETIIEQRKGNR